MLRIPNLFVAFILFGSALSQVPDAERVDPVRYGLSFSFDQNDRVVQHANAQQHQSDLYRSHGYSTHRIGFTLGLDARIPLSARWALLTGVHYTDRGFRSRAYREFLARDPVELDPAIPADITQEYHFQYLQLPLLLRLQFGDRRLRPTAAAGVTVGYLLGVFRHLYEEIPAGPFHTERVEDEYDFRSFDLSPTASIGLTHRTTERIWIRLDLVGRYSFIPVTPSPERGYLYGIGVQMGVLYTFTAS